jgi:hypothetical protein
MLLVATVRGTGWTPNTPTNWTPIDNHTNTTSNLNRVYLFAKRYGESEAGPSLSWTGSGTNQTAISQIFGFGGVKVGTSVEVAGTWTDSAAIAQNIGPITATSSVNPDAMAVAVTHKSDNWTSVAPDGTWVEASEADTNSGSNAGISVAYKKMPSAASSATYTPVVTGGTTDHWTGIILILGARTGVVTNEAGFEGGTDGNTVVPNSAACPELAVVSGTGACTFSNAHPHRGGMGILINPTAGSERVKFNNAIPGPIMFVRGYFWISDTTPASPLRIMEIENYTGTPIGSIALSTAGLIRVQTSGGTNIVNSGTTMSASTMYRLELLCDVTGNDTIARIYTGALLEAVGTDYTDTCATSVTASIPWAERCLAGAGTTEATNIFVDDFAYSTADWVGPALVTPKPYQLRPLLAVQQSSRW